MMQTAEPLVLTRHAAERMTQMGVGLSEVLRALHDPETSYPSLTQGRRVVTHGRLAVVLDTRDHAVITVLWNRLDGR